MHVCIHTTYGVGIRHINRRKYLYIPIYKRDSLSGHLCYLLPFTRLYMYRYPPPLSIVIIFYTHEACVYTYII